VLRASVMALVAMAAMLAGRPVRPLRLLSIAVVALLLVDPFLLHSVGFLLSVGATAGIACCSVAIARHLRGPRWFRETLAVTLAAQIGAAPVLLPVFGAMPAVTPIANLVAVPVAEPVTVYGLLVSFAIALFAPLRSVAGVLHLPTALMLRWVAAVATTSARVHVTVHAATAYTVGLVALACATGAVAAKRAGSLRRDALDPVPDAAPR
jgi:competence protein ComEC